ncbi:LacI family DNA-binding transcriptional regulator [Lactococcus kimchii]|uniref:LacI family DNA-binding transcriptional regulator n=1 Tax=Lactococcus sp. S-13 TaxID=2507158 RepID=UPI0010238E14|nr:LacI family DNA-binding transcriptional regulator [Lactococcus sp. S-13]RZI48902.1 LacI family transcriptional regulator [Lactococcus sp. S-13]
MAVTIKDVAKRAGVNASTVSRVIKDSSEISEKTKAKVRKAMQDLGYRRNAAAQILASGKSNTIGVVFPPVTDKASQPFFMKILTSINETAREYDISVAIATGHSTWELKKQVELQYSEKRVDGFIVLYAGKSDEVRTYLLDHKVPFVLVGTPLERQNEITHVDNDNMLLGREAVRHLVELNHQNISFVTNTLEGEVFAERYQGFKDETKRLGLSRGALLMDRDFSVTDETALVVLDDVLALKVVERLSSQGLRVPEDISLVTYNNSIFGSIIHPYLTTFDINIEQLGAAAVRKILDLRDAQQQLPEKTIIPFELIVRESTKVRA